MTNATDTNPAPLPDSLPLPPPNTPITTLFTDVGGVLLTNGWDRKARRLACETFNLDYEDIDERHHLSFDTYEEGKLTLDQYLDQVIFHDPRSFTHADFRAFMYAQSKPYPEMIELVKAVKQLNNLRLVVVSNEGRELTTYRVETFEMRTFVDAFIFSSFVHFRKPDADIYRMALDISQETPAQGLYIDDRPLFVQIANSLGIRSFVHKNVESTRQKFIEVGLKVP